MSPEEALMLARPDTYAEARLGFKLHPKQSKVLRDLFSRRKSRLAWFCSNEVGKTSRVAVAAILYALEIKGARVQMTSGSNRQLKDQLVPNLKRQDFRFPAWEFLDQAIKINNINQFTCFAARDQGTFQGFHEDKDEHGEHIPQLIICDETAAVADDIIMSAEDRCNPTWLLFMGSPLDPVGKFYAMSKELSQFYSIHRLNKLECTVPKAGWHEPDDIARTLMKNCQLDEATARRIVETGEHGGLVKDPDTLSSVFGEFSSFVEHALLTLSEYEKCMDNPPPEVGQEVRAFCDFAGGRAKNVFAMSKGNRVWIVKKWIEPNEMTACAEFVQLFKEAQREHGLEAHNIHGDGDGLGGPMVRRIQQLGWPINDFHGGIPDSDERFANKISKCYSETVQRIKECKLILPRDDAFRQQVLTRTLKRNDAGKFKLESKDDMRSRGLPSPDEADAICGAVGVGQGYTPFNVLEQKQQAPLLKDRNPGAFWQPDRNTIDEARQLADMGWG